MFHANNRIFLYEIIRETEFAQLLCLIASGDPMQDCGANVQSLQDKAFVEVPHDFIATAVLPCNQLMKRSTTRLIKRDERCSLHTQTDTQNIFGGCV